MRFWPAAAVDTIAIVVFSIVGRRAHAEPADLAGVWHTAWPFLAGAVVGTLVGRAWRDPTRFRTGLIVWAGTVLGGIGLRLLSGSTAQTPFVIVTAVILAVLLLGWRAICVLIRRAVAAARAARA